MGDMIDKKVHPTKGGVVEAGITAGEEENHEIAKPSGTENV